MTTHFEHYLKTGGDPRTLADYAALRDEMNKLIHPARPVSPALSDATSSHLRQLLSSYALLENRRGDNR
ncbi:hypothetical protein ABTG84_004949 [Klebsiella aerogenes]|nr:hypothetical protein [Klebsiella aerogenes]EKZ6548478.1 hypothetical protein [Klebsiella aerogenes]EKZ6676755.1 hypothetical protein [Klebsiella aerogenes]KZR11303.1 hypothetical protein A3N65_12465 [Klebsiella aerogenes]